MTQATTQTESTGDRPTDHGTPVERDGQLPSVDDGTPDGQAAGLPPAVRRRLAPFNSRFDLNSWIATAVIVAIAAIVRLVGLTHPPGKVFDEIYYATDAHNLLLRGFEWDEKNNVAAYVVHPPLGKWMIAIGEWIFGYNELGWRFSAAMAGTLSVLLLVRIARRMFRSTVLGCAAGLLLALDGFHFVLSRTALLDIFLLLFVLASFGALVRDRDARRAHWLRVAQRPAGAGPAGPGLTDVPWWRLLAGVLLGCAIAVKWSALYFVPAFLLLVLLWEAGARRSAGIARPWRQTAVGEIGWLAVAGVLMVATYISSWSGWLLTDGGYFRHWLADNGRPEPPIIGALQNLVHYHQEALKFHTGLQTDHQYQSWPWQWLLLGRPVAFYWSGDGPCGATSCAAEVLLLGTPILWWSFLPAMAALLWLGIARRDWRSAAILVPIAAGLLPWFYYAFEGRTMFSFYTAPVVPFLVLAVTYVLGAIISGGGGAEAPAAKAPAAEASAAKASAVADPVAGEPPAEDGAVAPEAGRVAPDTSDPVDGESEPVDGESDPDRRLVGAVIAGAYVLVVAAGFAYFYPIFVGESLPYAEWSARMWLGARWI